MIYKIETEKEYNKAINIIDQYWDDDNMSDEENHDFDNVLDAVEEYEKDYNAMEKIKAIADNYCRQQNQLSTVA